MQILNQWKCFKWFGKKLLILAYQAKDQVHYICAFVHKFSEHWNAKQWFRPISNVSAIDIFNKPIPSHFQLSNPMILCNSLFWNLWSLICHLYFNLFVVFCMCVWVAFLGISFVLNWFRLHLTPVNIGRYASN